MENWNKSHTGGVYSRKSKSREEAELRSGLFSAIFKKFSRPLIVSGIPQVLSERSHDQKTLLCGTGVLCISKPLVFAAQAAVLRTDPASSGVCAVIH